MNTARWLTCIALSLTVHFACLKRADIVPSGQASETPFPVVVAGIEPVPIPPEHVRSSENLLADESGETQTAESTPERFRPNAEMEDREEELTQEPDRELSNEEPERESPERTEDPAGEPLLTPQEREQAIRKYRSELHERFQDQWRKVPELNTVIKDVAAVPRIDEHFGIVILAYSFVDHKPGPPFLVFSTQDGTSRKIDSFDFAGYSNRIKDRMLYSQYRTWLDRERREHHINALMKVIGLVPPETDRYFSAKQLRAVQLAGVNLDHVRSTDGHYESDGAGGFNLIIDTVTTKESRTIHIQDEELEFSVGARK